MINTFNLCEIPEKIITCDYLVVGSGPGGGVSALRLAEEGKNVLIVEEGDLFLTHDFSDDISGLTRKLYRDGGLTPILGKNTVAFTEGVCVGGGSVINGGLIWRTPEWVLDEWIKDHQLTNINKLQFEKYFIDIEKKLNVTTESIIGNDNKDSVFVKSAADDLGWKAVAVPRAVENCQRKNLCPTGCTSGAKQDILKTYLTLALDKGAKLIYNAKVLKLNTCNGKVESAFVTSKSGRDEVLIKFNKVVLAAGTVQTAMLLRKSGLSKNVGKKFEFHLNMKFLAEYKEEVNAQNGTIFTHQIQEFEKDGLLIMGANFNRKYLAMSLLNQNINDFSYAMNNFQKFALYTSMIRPKSFGKIINVLNNPVLMNNLSHIEDDLIRFTLKKTSQLLFKAGAIKIFLPVTGLPPIYNLRDLDKCLPLISFKNIDFVSVHSMSSCSISPQVNNDITVNGTVNGFDNILISDASTLPTNIGESPQGTIMAFANMLIDQFIS